MCLTIWTQNDFQWKGLIDEFLSNHNHHQHQHYSQKINQPPWYVISKWLKIRSIFSLNLNLFWSILEAWLFSIFCKSPRKVLRSITSLKMWSSGVPQADYGTSLKLDSCSEKSPPSLLKSTLHSRNLATDACLYMYVCVCVCMYLYVCVCICMCVYIFVCVCMYVAALMIGVKVHKGSPCGWPEVEGLSLYLCLSFKVFLSRCVHVLRRVCVHKFEGCYW